MQHVLFAVLDTLHDNTLNSNLSMPGCQRNHNCKVLTILVNTSFIISYILNYYTFYSLSVFSLAKSLQIILEISATYRLVSNLLADRCLICRLHIQFIISKRQCVCCHFLQKQYILSKTILKLITCTFCDTWHHHKTPENLPNNL